jgi:hypothetical protein
VVILKLCAVSLEENRSQNNGKPAMIDFSSAPIPQAEKTGSSWTLSFLFSRELGDVIDLVHIPRAIHPAG